MKLQAHASLTSYLLRTSCDRRRRPTLSCCPGNLEPQRMALIPQSRRAQAVRCRYLAGEAGDAIARRLMAFSDDGSSCNGIRGAAYGPTVAIGVSP